MIALFRRISARLSWELAAAEGADYMYVSNLDVRDGVGTRKEER